MQYFTTPEGRTVLYDNLAVYSPTTHARLFKATPALIDTLISRGSLSPVTPITSH